MSYNAGRALSGSDCSRTQTVYLYRPVVSVALLGFNVTGAAAAAGRRTTQLAHIDYPAHAGTRGARTASAPAHPRRISLHSSGAISLTNINPLSVSVLYLEFLT